MPAQNFVERFFLWPEDMAEKLSENKVNVDADNDIKENTQIPDVEHLDSLANTNNISNLNIFPSNRFSNENAMDPFVFVPPAAGTPAALALAGYYT